VIIMRESRVQNYRPQFRSPLYPWVQAVGVVGCLALLAGIGVTSLLAAIALIGSGLFLYWFYGRIRATREYALLHLIERITARDLTDGLLETELKEIVRQRDAIVTDRFDRLVEACVVLDLDEPMEVDAFFRRVAEELAPRLGLPADRLLGLLKAREAESSTVIAPRLAIPHFVIDGKGRFDVLLARCRGGIRFPGAAEPVQSVFVLAGTRDERNFHLRGLAAIAQIVQDPGFYERWMKARGPDGLKDLVLLGNRSRR